MAALACGHAAFLLATDRIPFNADQAVVSLMATHILDGRSHPLMFWGTHYGGTIEPHVVAAAFAVFGATRAVFRAAMCVLYAAFLAGTALFVARTFSRRAALAACVFLAIPPFFLPYKGLTSDGLYDMVALLGLACLWLAVLADERLSASRPAGAALGLFGLAAGLGLWVTPLTVPTAGAAALWLAIRHARRISLAGLAAAAVGAVAGAGPWLFWNLRHGWASVRAPELDLAGGRDLVEGLRRFLTATVPVFLGAARPNFSDDPHASFPGALVVVPVVALLLVLPAARAALRGRDGRILLLFLTLAVLSAGALASGRFVPSEPRFLLAGYVAFAALLGVSWASLEAGRSRGLFAAGLGVLLVSDVGGAFQARRHVADVDDEQVTAPLGPLLTELRTEKITRLFTNYWAAYRITFESGETILAAPIAREDADRYAPIQLAVREASDPAVVLLPPRDACLRRYLDELGKPFGESRSGAFTIFHPVPQEVLAYARTGALPMPREAYRVAWAEASVPGRLAPLERRPASVRVTNEGPCTWRANVRLVATWDGPAHVEEGFLTPGRVAAGESARASFLLSAPAVPGSYRVTFGLEQEGVARFSSKGGSVLEVPVTVAAP